MEVFGIEYPSHQPRAPLHEPEKNTFKDDITIRHPKRSLLKVAQIREYYFFFSRNSPLKIAIPTWGKPFSQKLTLLIKNYFEYLLELFWLKLKIYLFRITKKNISIFTLLNSKRTKSD